MRDDGLLKESQTHPHHLAMITELHRKASEVIMSINGLATKLFPNTLTMDSEREIEAEQWVCEHLHNPTTVRFQESHFKMQLGLKQTVFSICRSSLFFFLHMHDNPSLSVSSFSVL